MTAPANVPGPAQMEASPLGMRVQLSGKSWGRVVSYRLLENGRLLTYCQPEDASEGRASVPVLIKVRPDGVAQASPPVDVDAAVLTAHRVAGGLDTRQPIGAQMQQLAIAVIAMSDQLGASRPDTRPDARQDGGA